MSYGFPPTVMFVNGKVKVYQLWENKSVPPRGKKLVPMRVELSYHHLPVDQNV